MRKFLSYGRQWIDGNDIEAVTGILRSDFLTQGPAVRAFEDDLCRLTGAKYCVAVANGTAALTLAVQCLDIETGAEGITSANTFMASSNSMIHNEINPVFADIDPDEYCISPETIEPQITARTRLLIPVHFAGQTCRMDGIHRLAEEKGLFVIEDAAHAVGSQYDNGSPVGNCRYSDLTIFSFHPVKTITTGEGGAITTNNGALYERLIGLRSHGITKSAEKLTGNPGPWYHEMHALSHNFRLTDIQAALGISQLKRLDAFIKRRRQIVERYNKAFESLEHLQIPFERSPGRSAFHLYVLQFDFPQIGIGRGELMETLRQRSVGTQVHYIPVYRQPYYQDHYKAHFDAFPNMEAYYARALSIPLFPKMTDADIDYVIETVAALAR